MFKIRKIYYNLLSYLSEIKIYKNFTGFGLQTGSITEHGGGHHAEKRGYQIACAEEAGTDAAAPATPETPVDIAPFMAAADVAAGEQQLKKCTACHTLDKGGKNGVGPNQWGLVGSNFGHMDGYAYSDAIKAKHSEKWTEQALSEFLANPKKYIPGNKMSFAGMKKPEDRANLIAYLNTLK